jgi:ATP-dependent DNA helicase RecG
VRFALEQIELFDPAERLARLRDAPEDQWFDRKSARIDGRKLAETLVAFANAEGGCVVIGLADGKPSDAVANPKAVNSWRQAGLDFAHPPVRTTVTSIDWQDDGGRVGSFVVIDVPASEHVHATSKDEVLLRVGDENRKLTYLQRRELTFDKGESIYETTTSHDWPPDELDTDAVAAYAHQIGARDQTRLLVARRITTPDRRLTVAGMLLFGREPELWFPSAYIRVIRYRGTERGSGARLQVLQDHRIEGRIPVQISEAARLVEDLVPTRQALKPDGLFGAVALIPRDAWLEGIVNAAVHRSYSNFGDHTRVEIFDDRIEIESPGRFPGVVDVSNPLQVTRFARNPHIARVCAELGIGREFGEGIRRMFEEMRLAGLADPVYRQTAGSVRLTLPTDPVERELEERLPDETRAVARLLRDSGRLGTGEIVEATGRSRPWVLGQLRSMEEAGVIERVGKGPTDPRAYWQLRVD